MTTPNHRPGTARFVAYSTLTRNPIMTGTDAAELLLRTREVAALGFDNRFVEVLDCGECGVDADEVDMPLEAARNLYRTVFRGAGSLGQPGMPAFPLQEPLPSSPDRAATRAIEEGLSRLVDRAHGAGLSSLASILDRSLAEVRAAIAGQGGRRPTAGRGE